ncbi:MAG: flagellin [Treponemataceae bacterium]|nr:MAG: flagellin [Treponemataceae bacterium]
MIINHNMSAMFSSRTLDVTGEQLAKDTSKLSSGMRINYAADDAAGLSVSERMRSQIRGLNRATKNVEDGISFIQTSEGYLQETQDILHRVRELAVQSANGIYTDEDRMQIQVEVSQLISEVNRIASHAQFNGMNLLTGRFARADGQNIVSGSMWFHMGANVDQRTQVFIATMTAAGLGLSALDGSTPIEVLTPSDANLALSTVDGALGIVTKQRADLGAYQNRLTEMVKGIGIASENLQSAESRIRDANMAQEMVTYTKDTILTQTGSAMLAQANSSHSTVLNLLR